MIDQYYIKNNKKIKVLYLLLLQRSTSLYFYAHFCQIKKVCRICISSGDWLVLLFVSLHTPSSTNQVRYKLGVPGKTKEGHDCYVHYDKDCFPLEMKSDMRAPPKLLCHPFDPKCGKFVVPPAAASSKAKDGLIHPDPDCDPEYDYNCRLRHAADDPAKESTAPRFEDFLKGIMIQRE